MKNRLFTIILVIMMLSGLSLMLYPTVSNWWNSFHGAHVVTSYNEEVAGLSEAEYKEMWKQAVEYNKNLANKGRPDIKNKAFLKRYRGLLDPTETGMMGYIEIPKIDVTLPIYHSTKESILAAGVGHIEWSSLPVGGKSSHCVLSGHRGLPSARLFTDLDQLKEGDYFVLTVLNEMLTYEIDQIRIVEPKDTSDLCITPGKDYCTLVTCTPYGVNTHRLLIRGHRTNNIYDNRIVNEAIRMDTLLVAGCMAVIIFMVILSVYFTRERQKKKLEMMKKLL